jgi:ABC-type sulfate/molybdate transport systems ATPase subunit
VLEADAEVDRRDFTVRTALRVAPGQRLALFGPSGAGKTTVLEMIAGLVKPRRARIVLAGRVLTSTGKPAIAVPPWQRRVGLLRQDPGLFPHLSVRANLLYGRAASDAEAVTEFAQLTDVLGIGGLVSAMPARLSGGQAHRVALGRLLLSHCDALLLDEPYTGLDVSLRRTLTDLVVSLVAQRGVPSILVAHELAEAQAFADRLAVLDRGEMLQEGAADEVVLSPATRRVAELVGYTAFVPVRSARAGAPEPTAAPGAAGLVAGIHPDRVVCGRHPEVGLVLAGVVASCHPAGALWEIAVRTGTVTVTARLPEPIAAGRELEVTATDPPRFGPDGVAVPVRPAPAAVGSITAIRAARAGHPTTSQPGNTGKKR